LPCHADLVISWVCGPLEAYWLAPRTPPPLTAASVVQWQGPQRHAYLLLDDERGLPVGYGEVNVLNTQARRYWLGHLLVDPRHRGHGLGRTLTRLLLEEAFQRYGAQEVSLVVFPDNRRAIASYRAAGMLMDGHERHEFPAYGQTVDLVRMTARRPP